MKAVIREIDETNRTMIVEYADEIKLNIEIPFDDQGDPLDGQDLLDHLALYAPIEEIKLRTKPVRNLTRLRDKIDIDQTIDEKKKQQSMRRKPKKFRSL